MNTFNPSGNIRIRPTLRPDLQRVVDAIYLGQLEIRPVRYLALSTTSASLIISSPEDWVWGEACIWPTRITSSAVTPIRTCVCFSCDHSPGVNMTTCEKCGRRGVVGVRHVCVGGIEEHEQIDGDEGMIWGYDE